MIVDNLSRRRLLQAGAATGGGLLLSLSLPFVNGGAEAADADGFVPNAFIRIKSDGQIILTMPYVEMGQGSYTSIPMLIAEELEVDLKQVRLEHAPPNEKLYGNPLIAGVQATGNSNAIRGAWQPVCLSPRAWRSSNRRIGGSSAPRPSVSTHRQRSTGQQSMASTLGRRA
jgi:isoquinoline 1-oxidoreductase subunit beta